MANGETKDKYPLIISGLPYLIEERGVGYNVDVDVFKVSNTTLKSLDRLEGHPVWYKRKQIDIKTKDGVLKCWVYFNIKETAGGKVYHKSYSQKAKSYSFWEDEDVKESKKQESIFSNYGYEEPKSVFLTSILDEECDDCEFDIENEKPICVNCFQDLQHDAFSNYHCSGCDEWFTESEVLRFQP